MKTSLLILLVSLTMISSCGKKNGSKNSARYTKITEEQIQFAMDNQNFSCDSIDGSACPSGISRLLILDKENADNSRVCSGFMVNENTLVTNNHCVSTPTDCSNTYIAIYTGDGYEKTKCSKIIKTMVDIKDDNNPQKHIDYTVMKLERRYYGKTFKTAATNASINDKIQVWVIDHTGLDKNSPNIFDSRITEFQCTVVPYPVSSLTLSRCPVIHGNSGSPALNSQGEVIGVIWGATATKMDTTVNLDERRLMDHYGLVTNASNFRTYITQ